MAKLTAKQEIFVLEYLKDLNATQAAIRAGYSKKTARKIGQENLTKPDISEAIEKAKKKRSEKVMVDAEWVLKRLFDESDADVSDLYHETGGLKPVHEWPEIWRKGLVTGIDVEQQFVYVDGERQPDGFVTKIKLSDRLKRIELIGKHVDIQAFREKIDHTSGGKPINTEIGDKEIARRLAFIIAKGANVESE